MTEPRFGTLHPSSVGSATEDPAARSCECDDEGIDSITLPLRTGHVHSDVLHESVPLGEPATGGCG